MFIKRLKCVTWNSLSAFTNPPTSFLREKMIVARAFSDVFFSPFSSIFLKVDLFNCKHESQTFIVFPQNLNNFIVEVKYLWNSDGFDISTGADVPFLLCL